MRCLAAIDAEKHQVDRRLTQSVGLLLASRLVCIAIADEAQPSTHKVTALIAWRLRRVVDFVTAHIHERISLSDLADAAGLSRMHFAAAFRAATGVPPHVYVQQRKVEYSKFLLAEGKLSIAEIAATIGISGQSHFTTLFQKYVRETPRKWQTLQLDRDGEGFIDSARLRANSTANASM
jgi:AraC-like DNA-binding protein